MNHHIQCPEHLILTKLPVPPTAIRPTVIVNETTTNEDDLTAKLSDIILLNNKIQK